MAHTWKSLLISWLSSPYTRTHAYTTVIWQCSSIEFWDHAYYLSHTHVVYLYIKRSMKICMCLFKVKNTAFYTQCCLLYADGCLSPGQGCVEVTVKWTVVGVGRCQVVHFPVLKNNYLASPEIQQCIQMYCVQYLHVLPTVLLPLLSPYLTVAVNIRLLHRGIVYHTIYAQEIKE